MKLRIAFYFLIFLGFIVLFYLISGSSVLQSAKIEKQGSDFIGLRGCTTILVGKDAAADGSVILGHNEDMGDLSGRLMFKPTQLHGEKEVYLNYVTIPQVPRTYRYWASGNSEPVAKKHYDGGWILCGMNEFGVSFGCNTMSAREERIPKGKGIIRYALRQLILERSKTARDAVNLIGQLIDKYGQSDSPVAYCIADQKEAWLVETTYRHWVARRIPDNGFHVEANQYTIETDWDLASAGLINYAVAKGWYKPGSGPFNFKYVYGHQENPDHPRNISREFQGIYMLKHKVGSITVKDILSVLSQPPIQTTGTQAYMAWHLRSDIPIEIGCVMWFGMSSANTGAAVPIYVASSKVPGEYTAASYKYDAVSAWWQFEHLQQLIYPRWWEYSDAYFEVRKKLNKFQENVFKETTAVEKEALKLWKQGAVKKTKEFLTNHTYEMLEEALRKVKELISFAEK